MQQQKENKNVKNLTDVRRKNERKGEKKKNCVNTISSWNVFSV